MTTYLAGAASFHWTGLYLLSNNTIAILSISLQVRFVAWESVTVFDDCLLCLLEKMRLQALILISNEIHIMDFHSF